MIEIDDSKKISEVRKLFNGEYPFLRLQFFDEFSRSNNGSEDGNDKIEQDNLSEYRSNQAVEPLMIVPTMTGRELAELFKTFYGLSVQVFRKSGTSWLGTTLTDHWTLEKQNQQGEYLSTREKT